LTLDHEDRYSAVVLPPHVTPRLYLAIISFRFVGVSQNVILNVLVATSLGDEYAYSLRSVSFAS
jgi:hypothetical protein